MGNIHLPPAKAIEDSFKPAPLATGLKPGTTCAVQARAVKKAGGYSDYSDSVTRMVV